MVIVKFLMILKFTYPFDLLVLEILEYQLGLGHPLLQCLLLHLFGQIFQLDLVDQAFLDFL